MRRQLEVVWQAYFVAFNAFLVDANIPIDMNCAPTESDKHLQTDLEILCNA